MNNSYHSHSFHENKKSAETKTKLVLIITLAAMIVEIFAGWIYNSMALFADGWHMSTHAAAIGITLIAYILARKFAHDSRFSFGTWKIEILGAYTSSILLGIVGLFVLGISIERFFVSVEIQYNYALIVAVIGLGVNAVCALILKHEHHEHEHPHHKEHQHKDINIHSAYVHVIADALTSVFAIIALLGAKYFHWNWLDPCMGIVGAILIFRWTISLLKETSGILLDISKDTLLQDSIIQIIESDSSCKVVDFHAIHVTAETYACILCIESKNPNPLEYYINKLQNEKRIAHLTIEFHTIK